MPLAGLEVAVTLDTIGTNFGWWRDSAVRLEAAGYDGIRCWDHFVRHGRPAKPVLECWTTITAVAAVTTRVTIGPFVLNVMNRHPALVARMAATLQEASNGRLVLGIGIGGFVGEHLMYGMPYPPAPERVARLEEAVAVLRALWTGGPITRASPFYPLLDADALPAPESPPPIVVAGQTRTGARLAARIGDGWTCRPEDLDRLLTVFLDALAAAGRTRDEVRVIVGWENGRSGEDALAGSPWIAAPAEEAARWREAGADGVVLLARTEADLRALVEAAGRR